MTVGAWLRERASAPPDLTARIVEALGEGLNAPSDDATHMLMETAERLLAELVAGSSAGRESALDLLAVDALATYAFEAASVTPESVPVQANAAMRRLARIAAP
jgi:hypothetical protein